MRAIFVVLATGETAIDDLDLLSNRCNGKLFSLSNLRSSHKEVDVRVEHHLRSSLPNSKRNAGFLRIANLRRMD
ncbi:hypothetical protein Plhal304r1_c013g0049941 [Plasmopara halstedii]